MSVLNRRIHAPALALAAGITWGLSAAGLAVWVMITERGTKVLEFIADCYPCYEATAAGAFWGFVWGFVDAFLGLFVFALLYNLFAGKPRSA